MDVGRLTLFVLVLQAIIYGFMLWQMKKSTDASTVAAEAAKKSADAATEALKTSRITEQAVVLIDSIAFNTNEPEYGSIVLITLKNFGQTIAWSVELTGRLLCSAELGGKSREIKQWTLDKTPDATIAPQGTTTLITPYIGKWMEDDDYIKMINSGAAKLQYGIQVTYTDEFSNLHWYHCDGEYEPNLKIFLTTRSLSDEITAKSDE